MQAAKRGAISLHRTTPVMGSGPTSRAVQHLAWTATGSVQTREKHYISYRLESEHDPYRHLRRKKKQQKPNHAALTDLLEDEADQVEEAEAAYTSSPSLSDFFRRVATKLDDPQSSSSRHPAEAVAAWAEAAGSGALGTAGGLVQRSKTAIPIRYVPETSNHGRAATAPSAGEQSHQQREAAPEQAEEAGDVHRHRDLSPSAEGPRSGPMVVEDESSSSPSSTTAWVPQAVKDTGRKVVESVGDAAASVTHTAKQLWVGALGAVGSNPHESIGIVDKAKGVGDAVDSTYEIAVEKAADKMLEALDAALHRAKARGFPPGLTVTTIASAMGAQMIMAYTTKDDDAASEAGRKNANDAASAAAETRRGGGRGGRRKSSNKSKPTAEEGEAAASSHKKK